MKQVPEGAEVLNRQKSCNKGNVSFFISEANLVNGSVNQNVWIFDTAASHHHFCNNLKLFSNFEYVNDEKMVLAANGIEFPIEGKGDIVINFSYRNFTLKNVLYSSDLRRNLVSGPMLDQHKLSFTGKNGYVKAYSGSNCIFKAILQQGLYYIYPSSDKQNFNIESKNKDSLKTLHERFAHANIDYIVKTSQLNAVNGLSDKFINENFKRIVRNMVLSMKKHIHVHLSKMVQLRG